MSKVVEITDQNFDEEVLGADVPVEVDFWAPWCGPCKMVLPIYDKLSEEYDGRFKFCKINVDENQQTATKYQIMSIPMQKYFVNGENVDEILGAVPEGTIRAMVDGVIQNFPTDEKSRLKGLLTSWVEHNKKHNEKLGEWAKKAENTASNPAYNGALQAAKEMEKANERLAQALNEVEKAG